MTLIICVLFCVIKNYSTGIQTNSGLKKTVLNDIVFRIPTCCIGLFKKKNITSSIYV